MLHIGSAAAEPPVSIGAFRLEINDGASLHIDSLRIAGSEVKNIRARCGQWLWRDGRVECNSGSLALPGLGEPLPFRFTYAHSALELEVLPGRGERWHLRRSADGRIDLAIAGGRIERLAPFLGLPAGWTLAGRVDGRLRYDGTALAGKLKLAEGAFSDPAGLHAAEKLAAEIEIDARKRLSAWQWRTELRWLTGEAFWQPFYLKAQGQALAARGSLDERRAEIAQARLSLPGIGEITGAAAWDRARQELAAARLVSKGVDLAAGGAAFISPFLSAQGLPEVELAGRLSFAVEQDAEGLKVAAFGLDEVSVRERGGRFALQGVNGGLPWSRSGRAEGFLSVAGASAGGFRLGAFRLPIAVEPDRFAVARSEIPLLGSELVIERLLWHKPPGGKGWEGDLAMSLNPVELPDLTHAFGLPKMAGVLSASFPSLRYREGVAYLDGALVVRVFDGFLNVTQLRLEDPFGAVPRLTGDVEARHLDLGELTETFSFGRIEGYADAEIRGLELIAWKPQRFDARVESSPGRYKKRISQRAVQNISALGGGGAVAALQSSFLRIFEQFGYDKIGISCHLANGVCHMGGIEEAKGGFVLVKGGGLPSLTVIGHNRSVAWQELVDRLAGIVSKNVRPVIQ